MGDGDYMYAFQQIVIPIAQEFNPDLVIGKQFASQQAPTETDFRQLRPASMPLLVMSLEAAL
jgi:hypothetical protein